MPHTLEKAPVGVPGGPAEALFPGKALGYRLVDAHVEEGVHHPGKGNGGAAAYRKEERILGSPNLPPVSFSSFTYLFVYSEADILEDILVAHHCVVAPEDLRGQDKTRRDGKSQLIKLFQEVAFVPDEDLVVNLFVRAVERMSPSAPAHKPLPC